MTSVFLVDLGAEVPTAGESSENPEADVDISAATDRTPPEQPRR
jgi:hypothetical protein